MGYLSQKAVMVIPTRPDCPFYGHKIPLMNAILGDSVARAILQYSALAEGVAMIATIIV